MTTRKHDHRARSLWHCAPLFVVGVFVNYLWELGQSPLFVETADGANIWWHCFVASVGDGILVLLIYLVGWIVFQRSDWFVHPNVRHYGLMLMTGLAIAVVVEWVAVHVLQRWTYTASMPLLPGLGVGLVPIAQMLILPPVMFWFVAIWAKRRAL